MGEPDNAETAQIGGVSDIIETCVSALADIARDGTAPAAARAQAARTLLEYSGAIGRNADGPKRDKNAGEMSLAELDAAIARAE